LLIALPAAVGLGLLAEATIAVLFQGGRFVPTTSGRPPAHCPDMRLGCSA